MNKIIEISNHKLEIGQILEMLEQFAILPETKINIKELLPNSNLEELREELKKVDEAYTIILRFERAPIVLESDYRSLLMLSMRGAKLSALDIYETSKLFTAIRQNNKLLSSLKNEKILCPYYENIVNELIIIDYLDALINKSIDETGYVLDSASLALKQIRGKLNGIDARIKSKCQEILSKESDKLSQASIVMRNDCYCLPVKSEYKNSIRGTIQDYSASMQTVYIEPEAVAALMREKNILYHEEHDEIERVLKDISHEIEINVMVLMENFERIKQLDFIFSKAVLATKYHGSMPKINDNGTLKLINARHPLLKVKNVIPNNVNFNRNYDGIIITGPNTGGKTVLLKTIGLLSLMTKYGLLIPADTASDVMIYDNVYCDIGDDQSIENNLSTFSSHMHNIVEIINHITPKSLVLFDEIGAGTDPIEGSNLAIAILKYLIEHKVSFITTTHYSDLKAFGFEEPRIINASMEFDQNTLSPTYHLLIGVSGSSNALNIASRLGLKEEIIEEANRLTITNDSETRKLIMKLEGLVQQNEIEKRRLTDLIAQNEIKQAQLEKELDTIDKKKDKIISDYEKEASKIINDAKSKSNELLTDMQEKQKANLKLHEMIELKKRISELETSNPKPKKAKVEYSNEEIKLGDDVYLTNYDQYGTVIKVGKGGNYTIAIGNIQLQAEKEEIKLIKKIQQKPNNHVTSSNITSKAKISLVLDLRGERFLDAKDRLEKYIDDLLCAGVKQATIIHGYGTGALREMVQTYIRKCPHIASFRYGGENEGGFGVTVIQLK